MYLYIHQCVPVYLDVHQSSMPAKYLVFLQFTLNNTFIILTVLCTQVNGSFVDITLSLSMCSIVQIVVVSAILPHLIVQIPVHHPSHLKTSQRRGHPSQRRGVHPTVRSL